MSGFKYRWLRRAALAAGAGLIAVTSFTLPHTGLAQGQGDGSTRTESVKLPISTVVLFSSGVGYFQRDGEVAGFAVMRRSASSSRVGPLFAATPEIAGSLVSALAEKTGTAAVAIDVPDRNKAAVKLVEQMGLKPSFETARMYTGADPDVNYAGLFGVTSLELG